MSLSDPRWCKRRKFISQLQYDHAKQRFCELFPRFFPNNSRDMTFYSLDPNIESKENKANLFPPRQYLVCSDAMLQAVLFVCLYQLLCLVPRFPLVMLLMLRPILQLLPRPVSLPPNVKRILSRTCYQRRRQRGEQLRTLTITQCGRLSKWTRNNNWSRRKGKR